MEAGSPARATFGRWGAYLETQERETMRTDETGITTETYRARGENLLQRVRELIREGNVRRIIIRNDEGVALLEVPLTIGVLGAAIAPALAAIGALAALVSDCTIEAQRVGPGDVIHDEVPDTEC